MRCSIEQPLEKYKGIFFSLVFGVLTTVVNIGTYHLCYEVWGVPNVPSNIIAWVLALAVAYIYGLNTQTWRDVKWNILPLLIILFAKDYLFKLRPLKQVLVFLGKHATNIFLVHTLIRYYYCETFTYGMGHFLLVMGVLLFISLGLSIVIEALKKGLRYGLWIDKLLRVCDLRKKVW